MEQLGNDPGLSLIGTAPARLRVPGLWISCGTLLFSANYAMILRAEFAVVQTGVIGTVNPDFVLPQNQIADFCHRWQVRELALFGSVVHGGFRPDSDVDVLISFAPEARWSLFDLVTMEQELAGILGRDVDLVERSAVEQSENYIRRRSILDNAEVIYAS